MRVMEGNVEGEAGENLLGDSRGYVGHSPQAERRGNARGKAFHFHELLEHLRLEHEHEVQFIRAELNEAQDGIDSAEASGAAERQPGHCEDADTESTPQGCDADWKYSAQSRSKTLETQMEAMRRSRQLVTIETLDGDLRQGSAMAEADEDAMSRLDSKASMESLLVSDVPAMLPDPGSFSQDKMSKPIPSDNPLRSPREASSGSNQSIKSCLRPARELLKQQSTDSISAVTHESVSEFTTEGFLPQRSIHRKSTTTKRLTATVDLDPCWQVLAQDFDFHCDDQEHQSLSPGKKHRRSGSTRRSRSHLDFARVMTASRLLDLVRFLDPSKIIARPSSRYRLAWDIAGVFFLLYDLLTVPLQVFEFEDAVMGGYGRYVIAIFWTMDIFGSFFVGYHRMGMVEMRPAMVAMHYLKHWFILDVVLVFTDWIILIMGFSDKQRQAVRLGKIARGLRTLRLLRLMKFHMLLSDLTTRVRSEYMRTIMSVGKIISFIIGVNHFLACGFYGLQWLHVPARGSWVNFAFNSDDGFQYRYWTSMHWSLTQFTPASMEVVPKNTLERIYTVLVLLFALVTFSSFVSSITTAMTHLRTMNAHRLNQDGTLRRYLAEHHISPALTSRVLHYFQDRQQQNLRMVRTKEEDVELFTVLPESIKFELRDESFRPTLTMHPLFHQLEVAESASVTKICRSCMSEKRLIIRDELFGHGADISFMFFVTEGILNYRYPVNGIDLCSHISKNEYACEVTLWAVSAEVYGPFEAETNVELIAIERSLFCDMCEQAMAYQSAGRIAKYAAFFVKEAQEIVNQCRWQAVLINNFDTVQDFAQKAFEDNESKGRNSGGDHRNSRNSARVFADGVMDFFHIGEHKRNSLGQIRSSARTGSQDPEESCQEVVPTQRKETTLTRG